MGTGNGNGSEWDAAWSEEEQEHAALQRARRSSVRHALQDDPGSWTTEALKDGRPTSGHQEDDGTDAWGWGDEEVIDSDEQDRALEGTLAEMKTPISERVPPAMREITFSEKYTISSMPHSVFKTVTSIIEDGVVLTQEV